MTQEEKARAYDGAIERAKKWYNAPNIDKIPTYGNRIVEEIFPELKESESEDERIRKEIITFLTYYHTGQGNSVKYDDGWIAWLEKQNPIMAKSPQLGERESTDKVKPKFKVGDWVVVDGITQKVTHIQAEGFDTDRAWNGKSTFKDVHLWTIADVKDCDVLVDVYGNVGIYKSHDDFNWLSYCSLGYYGGFQHFTIEHDNEKTYPATKEQRNALLKAMADAGYTFDFEKKELKKISQRMISAEAKEAMYGKPTAWSEEDALRLEEVMCMIEANGRWVRSDDAVKLNLDWLKSLQQRIGE